MGGVPLPARLSFPNSPGPPPPPPRGSAFGAGNNGRGPAGPGRRGPAGAADTPVRAGRAGRRAPAARPGGEPGFRPGNSQAAPGSPAGVPPSFICAQLAREEGEPEKRERSEKRQGENCSERTQSLVLLLSGLLLLLFGGQGGVVSLIRGSLPSPPPDGMKEELISSPPYSTLCLESIVRTSNSRSLMTTKYDLCFHQRQTKYPNGLKVGRENLT